MVHVLYIYQSEGHDAKKIHVHVGLERREDGDPPSQTNADFAAFFTLQCLQLRFCFYVIDVRSY